MRAVTCRLPGFALYSTVGLAVILAGVAGAQSPPPGRETLETVLKRASDYVQQYQSDFSTIVAEETLVQTVKSGASRSEPSHRELLSDVILVRTRDDEAWVQYRDVFAVDGKPVRDRSERLLRLLSDSATANSERQLQDIQAESARYNLGAAQRTINMPLLALAFLFPELQSRLRFTRANPGDLSRVAVLTGTTTVWAVDYRERQAGTLIRGAFDRDMPSHGRLWIDTRSGAVLQSELIAEDPTVRDRIEVAYRFDNDLQLLVPAEMREELHIRGNNTRIEGRATYSRFRTFTVQSNWTLAPPAP